MYVTQIEKIKCNFNNNNYNKLLYLIQHFYLKCIWLVCNLCMIFIVSNPCYIYT